MRPNAMEGPLGPGAQVGEDQWVVVKHQAAPGHVVPQPEPLDQEDGLEVSVAHALPD